MLVDEGLELLTDDQSLALLAAGDFGRVGVTVGALPAIFPVNYRFVDGAVVFRTGEGTKLRAALGETVVAFEVDEHDPATRTGWSVLAVGRSELVAGGRYGSAGVLVEPYAGGDRECLVRIVPSFVSGRRITRTA